MHPNQAEYNRRHRARKREKDQQTAPLVEQALNTAKAIRYAANLNIIEARRVCAEDDLQTLHNLEVHFYEAAQERLRRGS
jgi:hypothetical protein